MLHGRLWFPHVPLALLPGLGGFWLLQQDLGANWRIYASELLEGGSHLNPRLLPPLLIGGGMLTMAFGLLWRSRLAWAMAPLLAAMATVSTLVTDHANGSVLLAYFVLVLGALLFAWRQFDRADAGFCCKLLRAVRTANFYGMPEVSSLSQAIVVLVRDELVRILSFVVLSRIRGRPSELMRNALHRAHMCQLLAEQAGCAQSGAYFMAGLLSLVPAMLGETLEVTVRLLVLTPDVRDAMLTRAGDMSAALGCVESIEQAKWSQVGFRDLSLADINSAYVETCTRVEESMARVQST